MSPPSGAYSESNAITDGSGRHRAGRLQSPKNAEFAEARDSDIAAVSSQAIFAGTPVKAEIMEMQAWGADRSDRPGPADSAPEVATAK
jgi:hypothetical protein